MNHLIQCIQSSILLATMSVCLSGRVCPFVSVCVSLSVYPSCAAVVFQLVSLVGLSLIWPVIFLQGVMCVYCLVYVSLCLFDSLSRPQCQFLFYIAQFWDELLFKGCPQRGSGWLLMRGWFLWFILPVPLVPFVVSISVKSRGTETNLLHSRSEFIGFVDKIIALIRMCSWICIFFYKKALFMCGLCIVYSGEDVGLAFIGCALLFIRRESCNCIDFTGTHKRNQLEKDFC